MAGQGVISRSLLANPQMVILPRNLNCTHWLKLNNRTTPYSGILGYLGHLGILVCLSPAANCIHAFNYAQVS